MHQAHLYTVTPSGSLTRRRLAQLRSGVRRLGAEGDITQFQAFRSLEGRDRYWVLMQAKNREARARAEEMISTACAAAATQLEARFTAANAGPVEASLLRIGRFEQFKEADKHDLIAAFGSPGAVAVRAFGSPEAEASVWRLDFDSADALYAFYESSLRRQLSERTAATWALDLPEWAVQPAEEARPALQRKGLTISLDDDLQGALTVTLEGCCESSTLARLEIVLSPARLVFYRRLRLDLSQLAELRPDLLALLLRAAELIRQAGGEVELIDNEQRVTSAVREAHLSRSLIP